MTPLRALSTVIGSALRAHAQRHGVARTVGLLADCARLGRVQRREVVRHRRTRAPKPEGQPRHLPTAPLDAVSLERKVYLSVREFAVYGNFQSENAARLFLSRHRDAVPTLHRGRVAQVARRDYDRYLQASTEQHKRSVPPRGGASAGDQWSL